MEITLRINGEEKTFTNDYISSRLLREAMKINDKIKKQSNDVSGEILDSMASFVVSAFNDQFTIDEFFGGIPAIEFTSEINRIFDEVLKTGGFKTKGKKKK